MLCWVVLLKVSCLYCSQQIYNAFIRGCRLGAECNILSVLTLAMRHLFGAKWNTAATPSGSCCWWDPKLQSCTLVPVVNIFLLLFILHRFIPSIPPPTPPQPKYDIRKILFMCSEEILFWRRNRKIAKSDSWLRSCLSVLQRGTAWFQLDGFTWDLISEDFSKNRPGNSSFIKIC